MRPHVQARRAGLQREHTHDAVVESRATSGTCQPLAAPARAGTRMLNIGHAGGGGDDDLPMVVARRARQPACRAEHAWVHDRRESHLTQPRVLVSLSAPLVHRFHSLTLSVQCTRYEYNRASNNSDLSETGAFRIFHSTQLTGGRVRVI